MMNGVYLVTLIGPMILLREFALVDSSVVP
jgi:hypothetical protein